MPLPGRGPITPGLHCSITPLRVVRQFHYVIKKARTQAHVQNGDLAGIGTGDRLEAFDALELALERAAVVEGRAMNDLQRDPRAGHVAREPDFSIRAAADRAQQLIVGDGQRTSNRRDDLIRHWSGVYSG